MEYEFKKTKCEPCELQDRIQQAKDGDFVAVPEKCVSCDYYLCNYRMEEISKTRYVKVEKMSLLKAILAGISAGLKCLFWPGYSKRKF